MSRARKNLTLEQRIEIARRAHAGEAPKDLSAEYCVTVRHISRLAKEHRGEGVEVRDPSEIVSFRAAQSELEAFDAEWRARGFSSRSQALKSVVRARCGVLDVPADRLDTFAETWRQSRDLTDAGMALAKAVRQGRLGLTEADRTLVSELVDLAQRMTRELGRMKDHAQVQRGAGMPEVVDMQGRKRRVEPSGANPIQGLNTENRNALNG